MRRTFSCWIIGILLLGTLGSPAAAAACSPSRADTWYLQDLALDDAALPPGILAHAPQGDFDPSLLLTNTTSMPLYLYDQPLIAGSPFPTPTLRLDDVSWAEWQPDLSRWWSLEPEAGSWSMTRSMLPQEPWVERDHDLRARPANAVAPPPHRGTVHASYGDAILAIPLTITYALDPAYDPASFAAYERGRDACRRMNQMDTLMMLGLGAGALLLAAGAVLLALRFTRSRA